MSNDHGQGSPATKAPDAKTASQWLTDALNEAKRHTNDHNHVAWLIDRQNQSKIHIDLG